MEAQQSIEQQLSLTPSELVQLRRIIGEGKRYAAVLLAAYRRRRIAMRAFAVLLVAAFASFIFSLAEHSEHAWWVANSALAGAGLVGACLWFEAFLLPCEKKTADECRALGRELVAMPRYPLIMRMAQDDPASGNLLRILADAAVKP